MLPGRDTGRLEKTSSRFAFSSRLGHPADRPRKRVTCLSRCANRNSPSSPSEDGDALKGQPRWEPERPEHPRAGRAAPHGPASRRGSRCRRPAARKYRELKSLIDSENLHTVCQEAACPNIGECWQRGTATFMILGDTCTRRCGFCNVKTGKPTWNDPLEPARVARSVARMGLRHAVITSVDRDDLPDLGASAFVGVIRQIRRQAPRCKRRSADPRLPRRGDAARQGHRRTPRRVQPQRRGGPPAVPARPPRLEVRAVVPRAQKRQGARRRRSNDEVRPDGGTGRKL